MKRVQALDTDSYATVLDFEAFYRFLAARFAINNNAITDNWQALPRAERGNEPGDEATPALVKHSPLLLGHMLTW